MLKVLWNRFFLLFFFKNRCVNHFKVVDIVDRDYICALRMYKFYRYFYFQYILINVNVQCAWDFFTFEVKNLPSFCSFITVIVIHILDFLNSQKTKLIKLRYTISFHLRLDSP